MLNESGATSARNVLTTSGGTWTAQALPGLGRESWGRPASALVGASAIVRRAPFRFCKNCYNMRLQRTTIEDELSEAPNRFLAANRGGERVA